MNGFKMCTCVVDKVIKAKNLKTNHSRAETLNQKLSPRKPDEAAAAAATTAAGRAASGTPALGGIASDKQQPEGPRR